MLVPTDRLLTRVNYFLGRDVSGWRPGVRTFGTVTWRELYPGISLSLTGLGGSPALVVRAASGADLADFRLRLAGADAVQACPQGRLVASTATGRVALPAVVLEGRSMNAHVEGTDVSFAAPGKSGSAARSSTSALDPTAGAVLEYGTFLGGTDDDETTDVAVGSDGSTYVTGWTYSSDFPTTPGAFDTTLDGYADAFVSKLDPTGATLAYSTFLGGTGGEAATSLTLGPDGAVYLGGWTASDNFPTTPGAFDTTYGNGDGFVTELDPQGATLVYSTFIGGESSDLVDALTLASDGAVYATGETHSVDFPTTPGAFDRTLNREGEPGSDAFATALNADGSALVYSTFLGGRFGEEGFGIAVGPDGTAYVTGITQSFDLPTTPQAYDRTFNGGDDVFVTRVNADGTSLTFSTFLGGSDYDLGYGIAVDGAGNAYLTGSTQSADFPTTAGAYDTTFDGLSDAFATVLDPTGHTLRYSTLLGGADFDSGLDLSVDPDGSLTLVGDAKSSDFPTTPGAFRRTMGGSGDAFVSRFDPTGSRLAYSTFLGGTDVVVDLGSAIASAGRGAVTVAGDTASTDFPVTAGAYDTTYNGGWDTFVATLQVAPTMHVASIDPAYAPSGQHYIVGARVRIVSAGGSPVQNALVTVELDEPDGTIVDLFGRTGANGIATVKHQVSLTGTYTFTVLDVVRPPSAYDPSQNVETMDSVTIP